jgi:hypothetical protein
LSSDHGWLSVEEPDRKASEDLTTSVSLPSHQGGSRTEETAARVSRRKVRSIVRAVLS